MAVQNVVTTILINIVWPWVEKHVWPHIQERLSDILRKGFDNLSSKIAEKFDQRTNRPHQAEAERKAEEADVLAEEASSETEKLNYQNLAKVWREVAEELRTENETLKAEIEGIISAEHEELSAELLSGSPKLKKVEKEAVLEFKGNSVALPAPRDPDEKP
ncbi:MAG: hypothetical protein ABFR19_05305 [Pseudomonadota bacterium]